MLPLHAEDDVICVGRAVKSYTYHGEWARLVGRDVETGSTFPENV